MPIRFHQHLRVKALPLEKLSHEPLGSCLVNTPNRSSGPKPLFANSASRGAVSANCDSG
jgi:hypothetical protein